MNFLNKIFELTDHPDLKGSVEADEKTVAHRKGTVDLTDCFV
jgi:hypothetical protein